MRSIATAVLCSTVSLCAQSVQDVGLTLSPGVLTVIFGDICSPFGCAPFVAPSLGSGPLAGNEVGVWGAAGSPFLLGISNAPQPLCLPLPGIANSLLLDPASASLFALGVVPVQPPQPAACQAARANVPLPIPAGLPSGLQFRLQAIVTSPSTGQLAFTVAIDGTVQ